MSLDAPTPRRPPRSAQEAAPRATPGRDEVPARGKGAAAVVAGERHPGTRWTVIRGATPGVRRGRSRARVLSRCACGEERLVFVEDLAGGRSKGCRSKACAARWDAVVALRGRFEAMLEAFLRAG